MLDAMADEEKQPDGQPEQTDPAEPGPGAEQLSLAEIISQQRRQLAEELGDDASLPDASTPPQADAGPDGGGEPSPQAEAPPEASEAEPLTRKPRELFVNIDAQGRYFVGSRTVTPDELDIALKIASVNNPGRASVIIRADRRCPWQYVVAAINSCLKAEIRDYKVTAREPEE